MWPFIVVTSLLQLLYFALLATAYRNAELSFVYPVARGVAPAIVLVVSVVALGHGTSAAQVAGVVLVGRRRAARARSEEALPIRTRSGSRSASPV